MESCPSCKERRIVAFWIPHIANMADMGKMGYDRVCHQCCVFYTLINKMKW